MTAAQTFPLFSDRELPSADLWAVVRGRRSIRRYTSDPVAPEMMATLLEAARWGPSAHNRQPWRFCVVMQRERRADLAEAMAVHWRSDLARDGLDEAAIADKVLVRVERVRDAPALIIPALCMEDMDRYPDVRRLDIEYIMGVQSVTFACENLLLAAHACGLGACWMCAALYVPDVVREIFDLPASWDPMGIITLGWPAEVKERERAPIAAYTLWR